MSNQSEIWRGPEADAWFLRASGPLRAATQSDDGLRLALDFADDDEGRLIDLGGSSGRLAEGLRQHRPNWECWVIDPSRKAIDAGRAAFPDCHFLVSTLVGLDTGALGEFDLVLLLGVLNCVDRGELIESVSVADRLCRDGGAILLGDFAPAVPRANQSAHDSRLWTYKQDYAGIFESTGIYERLFQHAYDHPLLTTYDENDPYDKRWSYTVIRKDLQGRYPRYSL